MRIALFHETAHLKAYQLQPSSVTCPFCLSKSTVVSAKLQQNPGVKLLTCRVCGAGFADRIPSSETLAEYYQGYYESSFYRRRGKKVTFDITSRLARHIFDRSVQYLKKPVVNILDFGGGDGSIAVKLSECFINKGCSKVNILLVDYNQTVMPLGDKRIFMTRKDSLEALPNEEYDLIIASAIIEHLPNPRQDLITLLNQMRLGAVFYSRTPYVLPFCRLAAAFGRQWDFMYPGHIHDLGPFFWNKFFDIPPLEGHFTLVASQPSIVETSFRHHFFRTLAAYSLKAPWYLLGNFYKMVGGWEVFAQKIRKPKPKN